MISEFDILYPLVEQEIRKSYDYLLKAFAYPDANKSVLSARKAFLDTITSAINAAENRIREQDTEIRVLSAQIVEKRLKKYTITQEEKTDLYQKMCYNLSHQQFQNPHLSEKNKELSEAKRMATIQRSNDIDNIYPLFSQR